MKLNFMWKRKLGRYSNGYDLLLNKINIGYSSWNGSLSRDMPKEEREQHQYLGGSPLFPNSTWYGSNEQTIQKEIEKAITDWFVEALKGSE